ncbi:cytochrome P450-like protein [Parathielavia hyrcaniae]|uniref:Cytochrome P450-like protein n=1 Tax=Parathielavia hyrcaniae TaxID=113614 RepID=A0AAN6SWH0_9PEZI|nr:cytochrome P450-like protein [Parathielavia hyrcaniae]
MSTPIPQPPGVPLLGNIFDVDPSNTWWSLKTLAEKYGEIFQIKVLGHRVVFVASAALAGEICDEKRFRKYVGGPVVEIRYTVHDSLFTAFDHEPSWGIAHRIIAPHLSPEATAGLFDEILQCTDELVSKWHGLGPDARFRPLDHLNRLNLEATTLTFFGKKLNCLDGPEHPVIQAMEDATSEAIKRPTRPKLLNTLVHGGKLKRATKTLRGFAAEMVKERQESKSDRHDLLWALLNGKDPQTGVGLSESQVIDEIVTMPIGSSTAPCAISAGILFLLQNPDALAKARDEIEAVLGADGVFRHEHVAKLAYVAGVVRETLRLSCAAPGFNIEPIPKPGDESPVLLAGGKYQVPHNQAMIIVLAGANRDPAVFEDPLAFRPERMMGDKFEQLPPAVKKWFGNGKRECIGKHWAWEFLVIVMAKLIRDVDFEAADPDYQLKQDGWFNIRPIDFFVKAKPRAR